MRKPITLAMVTILIAGVAAEAAAHGRHHYGHHGYPYRYPGYYVGAPLWWGPAYGPYPYYYGYRAPTVIIEREPTVYVQREPVAPGPAALWFYCPDPAGYFPYVKECSRPWVTVDPSTVPSPPGQ